MSLKWITFVGEGRSGHTILSAILDSHPHIRIAEEQKYITKWWRDGWIKDQIIKELLNSGLGKERKLKALPGALKYKDPLLAVGDKCGWDAPLLVKKRGAPDNILSEFGNMMGMEVKVIHTIRNPRDNIAAWVDSAKQQRLFPEEHYRTRMMIRRYAKFAELSAKVIEGQDYFNLYNDDLCLSKEKTLRDLMEFLGIEVEQPWLSNAINSINNNPNRRSDNREWDPKLYNMIGWRIIDRYPHLERYR
jgi:hypothetical protein